MSTFRPISLIALAGLINLGCVTVPPPASQPLTRTSDDVSCHKITANRKTQIYCGSPEQSRELDRRMALIDSGVTCRHARTPQELCLSAEQWERLDRMAGNRAQAAGMGSEAQNAIAQQSYALEQVRQQWAQATGMTFPNLPPPTPRK
jgi:hypothetical protein